MFKTHALKFAFGFLWLAAFLFYFKLPIFGIVATITCIMFASDKIKNILEI